MGVPKFLNPDVASVCLWCVILFKNQRVPGFYVCDSYVAHRAMFNLPVQQYCKAEFSTEINILSHLLATSIHNLVDSICIHLINCQIKLSTLLGTEAIKWNLSGLKPCS